MNLSHAKWICLTRNEFVSREMNLSFFVSREMNLSFFVSRQMNLSHAKWICLVFAFMYQIPATSYAKYIFKTWRRNQKQNQPPDSAARSEKWLPRRIIRIWTFARNHRIQRWRERRTTNRQQWSSPISLRFGHTSAFWRLGPTTLKPCFERAWTQNRVWKMHLIIVGMHHSRGTGISAPHYSSHVGISLYQPHFGHILAFHKWLVVSAASFG